MTTEENTTGHQENPRNIHELKIMKSSTESSKSKYTHHHVVVFLLTFFSYALFHATRKTFSNVKTTISEEWTPSFHNTTVNFTKPDQIWNSKSLFQTKKEAEVFLGVLDAVFMMSYAVGLYISGMAGDRFNLRKVLSFGMCSTGIVVFIFGTVFEWLHFYNKVAYIAVWILNGLLQSTGWPTVVAVMGNWFGRSSRGFVLGLWSACASVGNIIGAFMVSSVLDYGYQYAFLFTASAVFAGGIINFFGLLTSPKEIGLQPPDDAKTFEVEGSVKINEAEPLLENEAIADTEDGAPPDDEIVDEVHLVQTNVTERPKAIGFIKALLLPGVILYALSYACLKLVNYSFFFWLPFYLSAKFGWPETEADKISIWYDVGGIIGGTIAGFISDRIHRRTMVVIPMLILGIPALYIYNLSPNNADINALLMSIAGFFIGGVANLVSAAISADLGRQGPVQGNSEALSTVTGIVDGTGSVGAAIGQILVPVIQTNLGWQSVFILFMVMTAVTALCIFPMFIREMLELFRPRLDKRREEQRQQLISENDEMDENTFS